MPRQWGKKEIEKIPLAQKIIEDIKIYKEQVFIGLIIISVIVIFTFLLLRHFREVNIYAADILNKAQQHYSKGQYEQAIPLYDEIINKYPRAKATHFAVFFKGNSFYEEKNYKEAAEVYKKYLAKYGEKKFACFVEVSLGNACEEEGKWEEALKTYKEFIEKNPKHILIPDVYQAMGRCYEQLNQKNLAISIYEKIIALYQDTEWEEMAKFRIEQLK